MLLRIWFLSTAVLLSALLRFTYADVVISPASCKIPEHFRGDYYSIDHGQEMNTLISDEFMSNEIMHKQYCDRYSVLNDSTEAGRYYYDIKLILLNQDANCYTCFHLLHRSVNVLQYLQTSCVSRNLFRSNVDELCLQILPHTNIVTMFRKILQTISCRPTFEGTFQFTYETDFGGGGICDNSNSVITACQEPGSVYTDNQVFRMRFASCDEVVTSMDADIRFQCMGTWRDGTGNIYSALADIGKDQYRDRFKCMLTRLDQELDNNALRYSLSRWASCAALKTPYEGPIRLILTPVLSFRQLIEPSCMFPTNFTGNWYKGGEYDTYIAINLTHIHMSTGSSMYTYKETIFTCIQNRDNRYLVTVVDVGRCEMDYQCYDFLPRHHSLIRWRLSKSTPMNVFPVTTPNYQERAFRHTCAWQAFTYDRDNSDWMYTYFVMYPPVPYPCPIGGRYKFEQVGLHEEWYYTRVRGITERPRHNIDCNEYTSEIRSCPDDPTRMKIDVEYCATLDHTGKPIGEYEIADREMMCAGYWQEDLQSFLITYDDEDKASSIRCWVYERTDWRVIAMSRSSSPLCNQGADRQTAWSYKWEDCASLHLQLTESERLWDSCPQRYDTGANPWAAQSKLYILDDGNGLQTPTFLLFFFTLLSFRLSKLFVD